LSRGVRSTGLLPRLCLAAAALSLASWGPCPKYDADPGATTPPAATTTADGPDKKPPAQETGECRRPSSSDLEADKLVQWAMRDRLRKAVVGTERPYLEEGAWVYQCQTSDPSGSGSRYHLEVVPVKGGLQSTGQIEMQADVYLPHMPGHSECRTVGQFHVHPESAPSAAKPSGVDEANAAQRGIPSFIVQPLEDVHGYPVGYDHLPRYHIIRYGDWSKRGVANLSWTCNCASDPKQGENSGTGSSCALRGERYFGRLAAVIGTPRPEPLESGPLEWPRRRSEALASAIRADAPLMAHVVTETMGVGATPLSAEQLEQVMEGAFRGPMRLFQERDESPHGPYFGRREHDVVDHSSVENAWNGELVQQGVAFAHQATGAGGRIQGQIQSDTRALVFERSDRTRSFAIDFNGQSDGRVESLADPSGKGYLGSDGDSEGLYVFGVLVEARRAMTLRMTLRADARGDVAATGIVVPTVVLRGGALAAFPPAMRAGGGAGTMLAATTAARSLASASGGVAALEDRMAQLTPEQRRLLSRAMGGDPTDVMSSALGGYGIGDAADGRLWLPGPPRDRESVLYYVMTVIDFRLRSEDSEDGGWASQGAASVAVRLEVDPGPDADSTPDLPDLDEVEGLLSSPEGVGPVAETLRGDGDGVRGSDALNPRARLRDRQVHSGGPAGSSILILFSGPLDAR